MKLIVIAALILSACSPGMHRAYQNTMGGVALTGWGTAEVLTYQALTRNDGTYRETKPTMGLSPAPMVAVTSAVNIAIVVGIRVMPDSWFDEHTPWIKDALMTLAATAGALDGYSDYRLTR